MKMNAKSTTSRQCQALCAAVTECNRRAESQQSQSHSRSNQCKQPRNRIDQARTTTATLWGILLVLLLTAATTTTREREREQQQ